MNIGELKVKQAQFLDETVAVYTADPLNRRATTDSGLCRYRLGNKKCALGRGIPDEYYTEEMEDYSISAIIEELPSTVPITQLGELFLSFIQRWHDNPENWDLTNNRMSEKGERELHHIRLTYL